MYGNRGSTTAIPRRHNVLWLTLLMDAQLSGAGSCEQTGDQGLRRTVHMSTHGIAACRELERVADRSESLASDSFSPPPLTSMRLVSVAVNAALASITILAGFFGTSCALIGGPGDEPADDSAALIACGVIVVSGLNLLRVAGCGACCETLP